MDNFQCALSLLFLKTRDYPGLTRHQDVGLNTDKTSPIDPRLMSRLKRKEHRARPPPAGVGRGEMKREKRVSTERKDKYSLTSSSRLL